ncbi:set domain-containing protein [Fusarium coicis]|nr:set domain-containing protein [Fusarium coicis]
MVPRLSSRGEDQQTWDDFIERVMDVYEDDWNVEIKDNYIKFEAGEQLLLPLEGHKFLSFRSTPNDNWYRVEVFIGVLRVIACEFFDFRVRAWREEQNGFGYYSENEVKESLGLYEQPDPPRSTVEPLFEVRDIPGKGRGLIAKVDISAGARILCEGGPSNERRPMLKRSFGFDCACSLCSLPPSELQSSDYRRERIQQLGFGIKNIFTMIHRPEANLNACLSQLHTLQDEYGVCIAPHSARLYDEAFRICVEHGAVGGPTTFAEESYKARVICEGEDSPEALRMKELVMQPETHGSYGASSLRWKSKSDPAFSYGHYGTEEAEKRLFRQE